MRARLSGKIIMCFGPGDTLIIDVAPLILPPKATKAPVPALLDANAVATSAMALTATCHNRRDAMLARSLIVDKKVQVH